MLTRLDNKKKIECSIDHTRSPGRRGSKRVGTNRNLIILVPHFRHGGTAVGFRLGKKNGSWKRVNAFNKWKPFSGEKYLKLA